MMEFLNNFRKRKQPAPAAAAGISTAEQKEPELDFWQKQKNSALFVGGCLALLIVARSCTSHDREAKAEKKQEQIQKDINSDQSDKDSEIRNLQEKLNRFQASEPAAQPDLRGDANQPLTLEQQNAIAAFNRKLKGVRDVVTGDDTAASGKPVPADDANGGADSTGLQRPKLQESLSPSYSSGGGSDSAAGASIARSASRPQTLVISYRQEEAGGASPVVPATTGGEGPAASSGSVPAAGKNYVPHGGRDDETNPEDAQYNLASFVGKKYRVRQGTYLPCTQQIRVNGSLAGHISCLISIPVYSTDGSYLLMPMGTLAYGHVLAVGSQNQQRLLVGFDTFIMPDGFTVTIKDVAGTDQIGQTGLRDKVDHHYTQMFGASIALALVGGLSEIGNFGTSAVTAGGEYRSGVTQSLSESSIQILNKFTNILPTFVIREGARNNICLPFNLWLPDYAKHTMKKEF